jgi:hypothetical protein
MHITLIERNVLKIRSKSIPAKKREGQRDQSLILTLLRFESLSHLPDLMLAIRALLSHSPLPVETVVILQQEEINQSQTVQ